LCYFHILGEIQKRRRGEFSNKLVMILLDDHMEEVVSSTVDEAFLQNNAYINDPFPPEL